MLISPVPQDRMSSSGQEIARERTDFLAVHGKNIESREPVRGKGEPYHGGRIKRIRVVPDKFEFNRLSGGRGFRPGEAWKVKIVYVNCRFPDIFSVHKLTACESIAELAAAWRPGADLRGGVFISRDKNILCPAGNQIKCAEPGV